MKRTTTSSQASYEDREELLRSLMEKIALVIRGIHTGQAFPFADFTLGPPQVRLLFYIASRQEGLSVKEMAETLGVTPGAITQFVDVLVEKNLVKREEDPSDRRILRVKLTEFAGNNFAQFKKDYFAAISHAFENLSDEDIKQLTGLLAKIKTPAAAKEQKNGN